MIVNFPQRSRTQVKGNFLSTCRLFFWHVCFSEACWIKATFGLVHNTSNKPQLGLPNTLDCKLRLVLHNGPVCKPDQASCGLNTVCEPSHGLQRLSKAFSWKGLLWHSPSYFFVSLINWIRCWMATGLQAHK